MIIIYGPDTALDRSRVSMYVLPCLIIEKRHVTYALQIHHAFSIAICFLLLALETLYYRRLAPFPPTYLLSLLNPMCVNQNVRYPDM